MTFLVWRVTPAAHQVSRLDRNSARKEVTSSCGWAFAATFSWAMWISWNFNEDFSWDDQTRRCVSENGTFTPGSWPFLTTKHDPKSNLIIPSWDGKTTTESFVNQNQSSYVIFSIQSHPKIGGIWHELRCLSN